jgi:Rieske Fe-S protein
MGHEVDKVDRRQVLGAGVAGAALLVLPEACGSSPGPSDAGMDAKADVTKDVQPDVTPKDAAGDAEPDATLVDGGGACESEQTDWTRPINIMKAGIALKGTAYAFNDTRFSDTAFQEDRILVINPLTGTGYVAMSGVCTHMGCCPEYFPKCVYTTPDGGSMGFCAAPTEADGGSDGGFDAGNPDATADAAPEAGPGGGGQLMTDVLYCPCHGSVYDALTGLAIDGPAVSTGPLQIMKTCVGGGYVFVFIPDNGFGPGAAPMCGTTP